MQLAKFLIIVLLLSGLVWKYGILDKVYFPVKYVRTEGRFQYLGKDEIKATIEPLLNNGFFDIDVKTVQLAVSTIPWVESVTVKRSWPDTIEIQVVEKKPYVRWGEKSLITEQGVIFTPNNLEPFQSLIELSGPKDQQVKALEIMKGVRTALEDQSLDMEAFTINDRWAWKIKLVTGQEILLGRNDQLKKLQRFLKSLKLFKQEQFDAMAVIDLRYPNGFAVSWKQGTYELNWKPDIIPDIQNQNQN
jgi:cell division protein FtsQ